MSMNHTHFRKTAAGVLAAVTLVSAFTFSSVHAKDRNTDFTVTASAASTNYSADKLILTGGQVVSTGASFKSNNGKYELILQTDGDLVLYECNASGGYVRKVWSSGTSGHSIDYFRYSAGFRLSLGTDGTLDVGILRRYARNTESLWHTKSFFTTGGASSYSLRLSNDGELYVYCTANSARVSGSIWSSRNSISCTSIMNSALQTTQCLVSENGQYRAIMQTDGNFVIYPAPTASDAAPKAIWHSHTCNKGVTRFWLQQDGNLVARKTDGTPVTASNTGRSPYANYTMTLTNSGYLEVRNTDTSALIFTSRTGEMHEVNAAPNKIEKMISACIAIANDNSHGYNSNWNQRLGPDYDCSSLVAYGLIQAGFNVPNNMSTSTMRANVLKNSGWKWIPWSQIGGTANLKRGDILLNEVMHTEIYLGNNQNVGAHQDLDGRTGDSSGKEINVAPYWYDYWDGVLRYTG
ncbi:MAG: peptidoglycan amidohydrolase family protein [Acutalibacteraceae bacterium]|nr:peptidoglycan amidohydrolase family protein [Acutalibacteraceae bacterium]